MQQYRRSTPDDVFAMGLIFYELLTGKMPYKADSVVASLLKRTQERAAPVSSHDASIPKPLSNIVGKCMEPDVKLRYQSSAEILADLDAWQGGRAAATLNFPSQFQALGTNYPLALDRGVAAALVLAIVGFLFRDKLFKPPGANPDRAGSFAGHSAVSQRFGRSQPGLARPEHRGNAEYGCRPVSAAAHGQSQTLLHQILTDLRVAPATVLDPTAIRRVADFSNADRVVWGQYAKIRRPDPH